MQNKLEPIYAQVSRIFLSFSLFQGNFYRSIKYIRCCSYFYYRGLRNCIELIKIAISILNSTQFSFFIRSPFVSIYVCVCVCVCVCRGVSVLSKRGGERTRSSWNDSSEEAPLTADAFRIGFQRKPAKPDDLRGRRNARQNPSYLSSFIDRVVDRNHSFVCNQRCSQMRCQSGVEETKSNVLYFSFFSFFLQLQYTSTIEQSRKRRRNNILFHLSYDNII